MTVTPRQAVSSLRRHGVRGFATSAVHRLKPPPDVSARQRWYRLDLADREHRRPLAPEFALRRGSTADVPLLQTLPADPSVTTMTDGVVSERLAAGGTLWIVTADDTAAFSCWTFEGRTPVWGVRGGTVAVPAGASVLEDSLASPDFRGRGLAPGTWSRIADELLAAGQTHMFTKVDVTNVSSCRAVEKVGFRDVGLTHLDRRGWRWRVRTDLHDGDPANAWLQRIRRG